MPAARIGMALGIWVAGWAAQGAQVAGGFKNERLRYGIAADGCNSSFIDLTTGTNYVLVDQPAATVRIGSEEVAASGVEVHGERVKVRFGDRASAVLHISREKRYLVVEVVSVEGADVEALTFVDIPLTVRGRSDEPFAACVLARNLLTDVREIPQAMSRLRATCYRRFGFAGASAAVIGCPRSELQEVL